MGKAYRCGMSETSDVIDPRPRATWSSVSLCGWVVPQRRGWLVDGPGRRPGVTRPGDTLSSSTRSAPPALASPSRGEATCLASIRGVTGFEGCGFGGPNIRARTGLSWRPDCRTVTDQRHSHEGLVAGTRTAASPLPIRPRPPNEDPSAAQVQWGTGEGTQCRTEQGKAGARVEDRWKPV